VLFLEFFPVFVVLDFENLTCFFTASENLKILI
jgi:hypothetical protein